MAMFVWPGEPWLVKKGRDLVHSLVYCAALLVAPRAERRGEVVALYGGPVGEAEEYLFTDGGDFVLGGSQHSKQPTFTGPKT